MERAFDISGNPTFNAPFTVNVNVNHPDNAENRKEVSCRSEEYQVDYVSVQNANEESYNYHVKDQNCYRITNYPKGRVLLINNEFPGDSRHRKGASVDVRVMYELWDQMGCEVVIAKDLTTEKMLEATENFVNGNWSKSDFCVVIIMSHGSNDDLIVGIRHEEMAVKEIIDKIKQSKPLKGKPKVILFQMCRGNKMQKDQADSVPCADANIKSKTDDDVTKSGEGSTYNGLKHLENCASSAEYSRSTSTDAFSTESNSWVMSMLNEVLNNGRILGANIDEADEAAEEYVSETPDVMLAFSTQPGYAAFRNVNKGSWFIQSIAKVFGRYAATHHVKQLLELVKKDVKESYEVYAPGKKENRAKEEVDGSDTFGKKRFWLFPGFPSSHEADEAAEEYVSETPDVMLAFSTQPGYADFRDVEKGSWFIQSIAKVFGEYAATHDVKELLQMVKEDIETSYEVYAPGKKEYRGNGEVDGSDTFGKKRFWLFPGFPSSRKENYDAKPGLPEMRSEAQ